MKKRIGISVLLIICMAASLWGCKKSAQDTVKSGYVVYHINTEGTGLVETAYQGTTSNKDQAVKELIAALGQSEDSALAQPALPAKVKINDYFVEAEKLTIDFDAQYKKLNTVEEVLCRAAFVRTLTQIDGVDLVAFTVEGAPLTDKNGEAYGYMQTEDFVNNTGSSINEYQVTKLTLYFANAAGDKLRRETVSTRYNTNLLKEKLIVEQLMKGPSSEKERRTIPEGTKLLGVSLKDGICYLNFDEGILDGVPGVLPEVTIYSIVNSVTESGMAGRVQISVNGENNITFQETVKLEELLSRNLDILEE